jgi:hypothetical protein
MQAATILRLFFHGLIAFVDDRPPGMTSAYMLYDKGVADGHEHKTIISLKVQNREQCPYHEEQWFGDTTCSVETAGSSLWCACYIRDMVDLVFDANFAETKKNLGGKPLSVRPFSEDKASDISWLVQMANVNGDDGKAKKFDDIKSQIRARMEFRMQDANSCHLDQVSDSVGVSSYKIYPNLFVTDVSSTAGHVQALTEHAMFEVGFGATPPTKLLIRKREGDGEITIKLNCSGGKCSDILVVNDVSEEMCEEEALQGVGAHFLEYYRLALNARKRFPIRLREHAVPLTVKGKAPLFSCSPDPFVERYEIAQSRLRRVSGRKSEKEVSAIFKLLDKIAKRGFQTRIICPMAVFEN